MRVIMRYGKTGLPLDFPDHLDITVIKKKPMPRLKDPQEAIEEAFLNPLGCRPLAEEAKGKKRACILICDNTRPVPNGTILPPLIEQLIAAGLDPADLLILVATGLHRPNEGEELREVVGNDRVLDTIQTANHFARNDDDHLYVGTTPHGIPIKLDRRFVEADLRIAIGLVEPHFMAGYSGGRKVIIPGIAHQDTITVLHSTRVLEGNNVANCMVEGNHLHEEQLAAVRMIGGSLAVNCVIDEDRNISYVNFGSIEESHLAAVAFARPYFEVPVDRRFRTVVTSAAGYPLDRNYYQTIKGMVGVADILETNADLFIVSECSEGLGTEEYARSQAKLISMGPDRFLEETSRKEHALIDEWESVMQVRAMKAGKIHLYSGCLTDMDKALTGVTIVESVSGAVLKSVKEHDDIHVAVIPEGPYVIPLYRPGT